MVKCQVNLYCLRQGGSLLHYHRFAFAYILQGTSQVRTKWHDNLGVNRN